MWRKKHKGIKKFTDCRWVGATYCPMRLMELCVHCGKNIPYQKMKVLIYSACSHKIWSGVQYIIYSQKSIQNEPIQDTSNYTYLHSNMRCPVLVHTEWKLYDEAFVCIWNGKKSKSHINSDNIQVLCQLNNIHEY